MISARPGPARIAPRINSGLSEPELDLTREQKLELYRFMRLNRVVEERLVNLYRQGKVVGGLYRSLGQEATSVGTRLRPARRATSSGRSSATSASSS